jgi:hypothetical protein
MNSSIGCGVEPSTWTRREARSILLRHPYDKPSNLHEDAAAPRVTDIRPFPRYELPLPAQQRVGRRDRGDFPQNRTAHPVRPRSQPSAIVVGEMQSPGPKLAPQEPILFNQIRHRLPLKTIQPASQHVQHHPERRGVDHESDSYHGQA